MDKIFSLIVLCSLLNLFSPFIPNWEFEGEIYNIFFEGATTTQQTKNYDDDYYMINKIIKNSEGEIIKENYLCKNKDSTHLEKKVDFEEIGGVFTNVADLGTIICPKGSFHPHDGNGNEISITNFKNEKNRKWNLECFKHEHSGLFLAYYYNKDKYSLYGYYKNDNNGHKIWNGENEFYKYLYFARLRSYPTDELKVYPQLLLAQ